MFPLSLVASVAGDCEKGHDFFGLVSWYHYLPDKDFNGCSIKNFTFITPSGSGDLPLVALAIVDDLLRLAGLVAVGFVIYGGIQFIASQGNPENAAKARGTVINALAGLAIAITATAFVTFLGNKLGG